MTADSARNDLHGRILSAVVPSDAGYQSRVLEVVWDREGVEAREFIDVAPAISSHRHFAALQEDDALFAQVEVVHYGWALAWPGDIELSADWLDRLSSRI